MHFVTDSAGCRTEGGGFLEYSEFSEAKHPCGDIPGCTWGGMKRDTWNIDFDALDLEIDAMLAGFGEWLASEISPIDLDVELPDLDMEGIERELAWAFLDLEATTKP